MLYRKRIKSEKVLFPVKIIVLSRITGIRARDRRGRRASILDATKSLENIFDPREIIVTPDPRDGGKVQIGPRAVLHVPGPWYLFHSGKINSHRVPRFPRWWWWSSRRRKAVENIRRGS